MLYPEEIELVVKSNEVQVFHKKNCICVVPISDAMIKEFVSSDSFKTLFCDIYNEALFEGIIIGKTTLKAQISRVLDKSDAR